MDAVLAAPRLGWIALWLEHARAHKPAALGLAVALPAYWHCWRWLTGRPRVGRRGDDLRRLARSDSGTQRNGHQTPATLGLMLGFA